MLTATLKPTKSNPVRGYLFDADSKQILIQARSTVVYDVVELSAGHSRVFRLSKATQGGDPEGDAYDVVCEGRKTECDCKGFIFGGGRGCKHADAVRELVCQGVL